MRRPENRSPQYWRYKSFRDPLYGFIGTTERELAVIESKSFQRLRYLKQLSHAYLVYPSAAHIRFEHSLGAMHIANQMCINLTLTDSERELTRLVALAHDIGHGPFSHLFEDALKNINGDDFSHEYVTSWLLKDDSDIAEALGDDLDDAQHLLPVSESGSFPLSREIISSGMDADKLDYLRRDSYHVGVAYGSFDLDRILHTLSSTPDGKHLCIMEKGKDAIENYRLGRYLMHAQVYEHHTRLITDSMFLRALEIALNDGSLDISLYKVGSERNGFKSANHSKFVQNYIQLTDEEIMRELVIKGKGNAKKLTEGILSRRLLKRGIEIDPTLDVLDALTKKAISDLDKKDLRELEAELANKVGCDPELVVAHLQQMTIKLYDPYDILVKRSNDRVLTIEQVSPISASTKPIVRLYLFCPGECREKIRQETCKYFNLTDSLVPR